MPQQQRTNHLPKTTFLGSHSQCLIYAWTFCINTKQLWKVLLISDLLDIDLFPFSILLSSPSFQKHYLHTKFCLRVSFPNSEIWDTIWIFRSQLKIHLEFSKVSWMYHDLKGKESGDKTLCS
jgi:hypothetical protein